MARVLDIRDLTVRFATPDGEVEAVNDITLSIDEGETVGIVGESGSGKTQLFLAVMGLLAKNGRATGSARFRDREMIGMTPDALNGIRGVKVSMIFQDPMTSLNPYLSIARQMTEVLEEHRGLSHKAALDRAVELLDMVGIPEARRRVGMYPHEFSGGMRQRVMIAMSLLCEPDLLIADEPTTALDVTVQAQILELLARLQEELEMAIALITHDLGVVAGLCDQVRVMYAGRIVEAAPIGAMFEDPSHPYTRGLLRSMPRLDLRRGEELSAIEGQPPNLQALPPGCAFAERCSVRLDRCRDERPLLETFAPGRARACYWQPGSAS